MLGQLTATDRIIVADFEAGLGTVMRLHGQPIDAVVIVVEPTAKSLEVGVRAAESARESGFGRIVVAANRVIDGADEERVRLAFPDTAVLMVPDEPAIVAAERAGTAPLDHGADSAGIRALVELSESFLPAPS